MYSRSLGHILERAILLVVQEKHAAIESYREIGRAVIVIITGGTSDGVDCRIKPCLLRHIFELPCAQVVIQGHATLRAVVRQKNVGLAIAVIVKKTGARSEKRRKVVRSARRRFRHQTCGIRHRHEVHWNLRQHFLHCPGRFLHQRIFSLIPVCQADGRAQFVLRNVLEANQMLAGLGRVPRLLVGARQAEFSGSVQRVQLERVLESINRLGILLQLRVCSTQKIPAVGIIRINLRDVPERVHRSLGIVGILVQQAEIEPGMSVVRVLLNRRFNQGLGRVDAGQVQQSDALIQSRDLQPGIERSRCLKRLEAFLE